MDFMDFYDIFSHYLSAWHLLSILVLFWVVRRLYRIGTVLFIDLRVQSFLYFVFIFRFRFWIILL